MEKAELLCEEERTSDETVRENRFLYIELSIFGILIMFPGLENATLEFASGNPVSTMIISVIKNLDLDIISADLISVILYGLGQHNHFQDIV